MLSDSMSSVVMLSVSFLNVTIKPHIETHYAECCHAECHFAKRYLLSVTIKPHIESHYARCHNAECHFAECHN